MSKPVAYADKIAFESAMKAGKGCDVWSSDDIPFSSERETIALYTESPVKNEQKQTLEEKLQEIIRDYVRQTGRRINTIDVEWHCVMGYGSTPVKICIKHETNLV
jgi:hypothetical protein